MRTTAEESLQRILRSVANAKKYRVVVNRYYGYTDSAVLARDVFRAIDEEFEKIKQREKVQD